MRWRSDMRDLGRKDYEALVNPIIVPRDDLEVAGSCHRLYPEA